MHVLNKMGRKFQSAVKLTGVALSSAVFLVACGGGGGGGSTPPPQDETTAVTLSGQVYDQEIANADVTIYVGDQAVANATTDQDGNYSVNLQVTEQARANRCVVVARRDNISLRSLLGNVGAIADTATANNGAINSEVLPSANVTNVSTAIAAVIETTGGALPDSQAEIDAAVEAIAASATLQDKVVKIAAAVKAVVDYGGDPSVVNGATNTEELAAALAASQDLVGDLGDVAVSAGVDPDQLELEVEGDPKLAEQIPSDEATLVAGLQGNTYVTSNSLGEETLLYFQSAGVVTIADYSDIEQGGFSGTYTDNQDGTFTITMTDPVDGDLTVALTVTGGSTNAISTNVVVTDASGTVDEGLHILRRIIPVATGASNATQVGAADLNGVTVVNVDSSTAVNFGTCDATGSVPDTTLMSAAGSISGATCQVTLGMIVISEATYGKTMHGLLADSYNGSALSQQMSVVNWEADNDVGSVATYSRGYQPIDAGVPENRIKLRILPDSGDGSVGAQVSFISVIDTSGDAAAEGKIDLYNLSVAKTKDHIIGTTHSATGSLIVNGSINEGLVDNNTTFWANSNHGSVSIGFNLGNNANAKLEAIFNPNSASGTGTLLTRYVYDLSEIAAGDVSGKTFTVTGIVFPDTGTVSFNADGTASFTDNSGQETFNWEIAAAVPANEITSGVASHGTTLVLTFADGSKEYMFAHKSGDTLIIGGYNVDNTGAFSDNIAVILTPQ